MFAVALAREADDAAFRDAARVCFGAELPPDRVTFEPGGASLLPPPPPVAATGRLTISREMATLIAEVCCHSAPDRFDLLYGLTWRARHGEPHILALASDPAVLKALNYARAVRRDIHKMHAFVRFRESERDGRPFFSAWFEPQHFILKRALPFFVERFANMAWLIATPDGSAVWRERTLTFGPGAPKPDDTPDAVLDDLWSTYFGAIFNPARLHVNAMLREMPKRYWRDMPETKAIPQMLRGAEARARAMDALPGDQAPRFAARVAERRDAMAVEEAERMMSEPESLTALRTQAESCTRCPLHANATQIVFGEGPSAARLMFVGEQPGDQEDLAGHPFVGPAGQVFDRALTQAGIDRAAAYVTNAVKHFKFEPRGKRRIHQKPNTGEVQACRWWLEREIALVKPALIVALGATAAQSLAGRPVAIMKERGRVTELGGQVALITVHPSFLLRLPDPEAKAREFDSFVADLRLARETLGRLKTA